MGDLVGFDPIHFRRALGTGARTKPTFDAPLRSLAPQATARESHHQSDQNNTLPTLHALGTLDLY